MKDVFKLLTNAIYPSLASLFIFVYTMENTMNISRDTREPIQISCVFMCITFFVAFVVGVVGYIVYSTKKED